MASAKENKSTASSKAAAKASIKRSSIAVVDYSYNKHRLYLGVSNAKFLFQVCAVSRAHEDPKKGYQRHLDPKRVTRIAEYINDGHVIPGAIILSAQADADVQLDTGRSNLTFLERRNAFLVIDGQHRLAGAAEATRDVPIAVCILVGLDQQDEVKYFLDVNGNQRGVPRTLQLEIMKFLEETGSKDDIRIKLFEALNTRTESPLRGLLSPHKSVLGKLSHIPFKNAVEPLLDMPPLADCQFEQKVKILMNFLNAAEEVLIASTRSPRKLTNAAFFQALFGAFRDISIITYERSKDYKESSFAETMRPLSSIDWSAHEGTNRQAISELTKEIISLIGKKRVSDDLL